MVIKLVSAIRFQGRRIMRSVYRRSPEPFLVHLLQIPIDLLTLLIGSKPRTKFVIFCQGRTGSSLLASLLASHPMIDRAWEVLRRRRRKTNLFLYVNARSSLAEKEIWGCKVKPYQLSENQKADPREFMERVHRQGWKIIYLKRRNLLKQAVSHFVRLHRGRAQKKDNVPESVRLRIEYKDLIKRIEEKEAYLAEEEQILRGLPHVTLVYEEDLLNKENHQRTLDGLFEFLDVPSAPVSTDMAKVTPEDLSKFVENFHELVQSFRNTKYGIYFEEEQSSCHGDSQEMN